MTTVLLAIGVALVALFVAMQVFRRSNIRKVSEMARWLVGGAAALLTGFLVLRGQIGPATIAGYAAFDILKNGRLGPYNFSSQTPSRDTVSSVRSQYLDMRLDHDTGEVAGRVVFGQFNGRDLISLDADETRRLLNEVAGDPDSFALLESFLDKNRAGWREYFEEQDQGQPSTASTLDEDTLAYEILGLKPGATAEEIRAAHRTLMKGVHPDQGGSNFLAAKINEAKDRLLRKHVG